MRPSRRAPAGEASSITYSPTAGRLATVAVAFLFLVPLALPFAEARLIAEATFEGGANGWDFYGETYRECSGGGFGPSNCYLRQSPYHSCNSWTDEWGNYYEDCWESNADAYFPTNYRLGDHSEIEFGARPFPNGGASLLMVWMNDGSWYRIWVSTGGNDAYLQSSDGAWTYLGTTASYDWNCFELYFDRIMGTVQAEFMYGGSSSSVSAALPATATSITQITISSYANGAGGTFDYDSIAFSVDGVPDAPSGLVARAGPGNGETTISWDAPPGQVDHYNVYRTTPEGTTSMVGTTTTTTFVDFGLLNATTYSYQVSAYFGGEGPISGTVSVRTFGLPAFTVRLTAATPDGKYDSATLGAAYAATLAYDPSTDAPEPPAPPEGSYVSAFFENPAGDADTARLDRSFQDEKPSLSWTLDVVTSGNGGTQTVSWSTWETSQVGPDAAIYLVDGANVVDMRSNGAYSFSAPAGTSTHQLLIVGYQTTDLALLDQGHQTSANLGQTIYVTANVVNVGTMTARSPTVTLSVDGVDVASTTVRDLLNGQSESATLTTPAQNIRGWHTATLRVASTENETALGNNAFSWSFLIVERGIGLAPSVGENQTISLGGTVALPFVLTNAGTDYDVFDVYANANGWSYWLSDYQVGLYAGQSTTIYLYTTAPSRAADAPMRMDFAVNAYSEGDGSRYASIQYHERVISSQSIALNDGWNLATVNLLMDDMSPQAIFGTSSILRWNGTAYVSAAQENVAPGVGYWVPSNGARNIYLTGEPVATNPFGLNTGWNLVGGPFDSAYADGQDDEVVHSTTAWGQSGYYHTTYLEPGRAYWIYRHGATSMAAASEAWSSEMSFSAPQGDQTARVVIGMAEDATQGFDAGHDVPVLPLAMADGPRASVRSSDGALSRAFAPDQDHASWTIDATAPKGVGQLVVTWNASAFSALPVDRAVWLVMPTALGEQRIDMRHLDTAIVPIPAGQGRVTLRVDVGAWTGILGGLA